VDKGRILIKLSGEALENGKGGVAEDALIKIAKQLKELIAEGYQVGVVLGGGNFFRGVQAKESLPLRRVQADQIGMVATVMNGMILSEVLTAQKIPHALLSALSCEVVETYSDARMNKALHDKGLVIFVGGTSHPYFTTDTAAALRATEMKADLLLKATTKVDGVYNKDPRTHADAVKYEKISYKQALDEELKILDLTAFTICMENKIKIRVYNYEQHSLLEALQNQHCGSTVG